MIKYHFYYTLKKISFLNCDDFDILNSKYQ